MKISIAGTGYVGLVTGVCFAETGFNVIYVDTNIGKIEKTKHDIIPI
jgi:UDPglucose 6-dehydrogenase